MLSIQQINNNIKQAEEDWTELKAKGKEYREKEFLDYNEIEIGNTAEKEKQLRKRIIQRIKKECYRLYAFQFLTKYVGRGVNGLLKRVHLVDDEGRIVKTYTKREEIEEHLINHNR